MGYDTSKYDQGIIVVTAFKADLGFEEVVVKVRTLDGCELVKGKATDKGNGEWLFCSDVPLPKLEDVVITIAARDKTGNVTRVV